MGNVGGNRNYGYGKQLAWAGKNALADRYGHGHFATRATHEQRWCQFVRYLKGLNIRDARQIDQSTVRQYDLWLKAQVNSGQVRVAYAQNLLSTVNVVLQAMRKDTVLLLSPTVVGARCNVRSTVPASYDRTVLASPIAILDNKGEQRVALIAALARDVGLRFREASLLNCQQAVKQANRLGRINITQGTKGGRGKGVDRWVPVNADTLHTLKAAADLQGKASNLVPANLTYAQWRDHANSQWRNIPKAVPIKGFHDMRAAYACERYQVITGFPAPVIAGERLAPKASDTDARAIIAQELGHNRLDVVASYIGSAK
ncbi:integrase [Exilibacterium tricleocarpae]|uniref:Integrase n=1 Tax=Exilibacterium tricleocarpae TaxID=2591008 RepID=A0A545TV07_9GAMM|nr:integrase domain-containing protein [Exilibacterium tricleocarpae]TQV81039.1 integrase [Exilibacterium tricleocarpae]